MTQADEQIDSITETDSSTSATATAASTSTRCLIVTTIFSIRSFSIRIASTINQELNHRIVNSLFRIFARDLMRLGLIKHIHDSM